MTVVSLTPCIVVFSLLLAPSQYLVMCSWSIRNWSGSALVCTMQKYVLQICMQTINIGTNCSSLIGILFF